MKKEIVVGDTVNVYFDTAEPLISYNVLYIPQASGDCWHLKRMANELVYVQQFCKMKLNK